MEILQNNLASVYGQVRANHMKQNELNFKALRLGPNYDLRQNTLIFSPDYSEKVDSKEFIKELGILVDVDMNYVDK